MPGIKGYSRSQIQSVTTTANGGPKKKLYTFLNVGVEQHEKSKTFHILLQRTDEATSGHRLLSIPMHKNDANWNKLRSDLLGTSNPASDKHAAAATLLVDKLATGGGLSLIERQTTVTDRGRVKAIYVFCLCEVLQIDEHPGVLPFAKAVNSKGLPYKTDRINSMLASLEKTESGEEFDLDFEEVEEVDNAHEEDEMYALLNKRKSEFHMGIEAL